MSRQAGLKKVRAVAGILIRGTSVRPEEHWVAVRPETRAAHAPQGERKQLLIAKRPPGKPYAGYWEFPGGKIENNESGEQALKRELAEELGIEILSATFLFTHHHLYPDCEVELQIWHVDHFAGEPEAKENQVLEWANIDEIKDYHIFEGNRAFLDQLHLIFS